jgi:hypothetical protein
VIKGFVTISKIVDEDGKEISTQKAVDSGLVIPSSKTPRGWGIEKHEIPIGHNLFIDNGRQILAYLFGNQTPSGSYVCSQFGIGTGSNPTTASFTSLQSPVAFYNNGSGTLQYTKPIDGIDFPAPFIARVQITLASTEANGILITEFGLYCQDINSKITTLLCRTTTPGVPKENVSLSWLWRVRL